MEPPLDLSEGEANLMPDPFICGCVLSVSTRGCTARTSIAEASAQPSRSVSCLNWFRWKSSQAAHKSRSATVCGLSPVA